MPKVHVDDAPETTAASRILQAFKTIEALLSLVAYTLTAALALLYFTGALHEMWVIALPSLQLLALKITIGAYYGSKVTPNLIAQQHDHP